MERVSAAQLHIHHALKGHRPRAKYANAHTKPPEHFTFFRYFALPVDQSGKAAHDERQWLIAMFRWCSFCQQLIGEIEPFTDYRVSHGICQACSQGLGTHAHEVDLRRARSIFEMLEAAGKSGSYDGCTRVIHEALDFGLRPSDIIIGILHPALYRIGVLWERDELSIAEEQHFTEFVIGLIMRLEGPEPPADTPLIILANAPGNLDEIGLRILQFIAREQGILCERIPAGVSATTLMEIAGKRLPSVFGLSVNLADTVPAAVKLAQSLTSRLPRTSRVVLGGQAFRRSEDQLVPGHMAVMRSIDEFRAQLESVKQQHTPAHESVATVASLNPKGRVLQ